MSQEELAFGYRHAAYAMALAEFGTPRKLGRSGGWLLERSLAQPNLIDATSCYPLLCCRDWRLLSEDLATLDERFVSTVAVIDPLAEVSEATLKLAFPDLVRPYKQHFIVELDRPPSEFVHRDHKRKARRALSRLSVDLPAASAALEDWVQLYEQLIVRHQIGGVAAFSPKSFAQQLRVPGMTIFRARLGAETVAMTLWFHDDERGYYHLGASSREGYEVGASFALFWTALEHFANVGLQRLLLGSGAGVEIDGSDGLTRFKSGWATSSRTAYLCGRIGAPEAYMCLTAHLPPPARTFFPAYRAPV